VGEEGAVHRQPHRHPDFFVLRDAVADQHVLERFLRGRHPAKKPAHVADRHRIVVLDAEGARIIQSAVAHHEKRWETVGRGND
jgi:hypothetical protein